MRKERKNKLMPILMTLVLLLSMIVFVQSPVADVWPDGDNGDSLGLTPGDIITWETTDNTLNASEDYSIWIEGTKWIELEDDSADDDGDIAIEFHVPGWTKLGEDPVGNSPYTIELHDESNSTIDGWTIYIDHYHHVKFKHGGDWLDSLIFNETYSEFTIYVYNWTGNKYELVEESIDIDISEPAGPLYSQTDITSGMWDIVLDDSELDWQYASNDFNREYYLIIDVTEGTMTSMKYLPVRLDITATLPTDAVWGETISIPGYVYDGHGDGVPGYHLRLYAPVERSEKYVMAYETDTFSNGKYTITASSGPDVPDRSAGTWYIGTYFTNLGPPECRIRDGNMYENPVDDPNFVMYHSFEVATDDSANVRVEEPDEIVSGFNQLINISVYNSSDWDPAFMEMWVHMTGIEANYSGTLYEKEDVITLGNYATNGTGVSESQKYAYYVFKNIKFEETGSGTIFVTHPYSDEIYSDNDFDNDDLKANISGSVDFNVDLQMT